MSIPTVIPAVHRCGHHESVDLTSLSAAKRTRRAQWLASRPCPSCREKRSFAPERDSRHAEALRRAVAFESQFGLLSFEGDTHSAEHAAIARFSLLVQAMESFASPGFDEVSYHSRIIRPARWIKDVDWWADSARFNDPSGAEVEQRLAAYPFLIPPNHQ